MSMKRKVVNPAPEVAIEPSGPNPPCRLGVGVKLIPLCGMVSLHTARTNLILREEISRGQRLDLKTLQLRDRG